MQGGGIRKVLERFPIFGPVAYIMDVIERDE